MSRASADAAAQLEKASAAKPPALPAAPPRSRVRGAIRGTWLDRQEILLEEPLDRTPPLDVCNSPPSWPASSRASVERLADAVGLDDAGRRDLVASSPCDASGCMVTPSMALLQGLRADQRAALYEGVISLPARPLTFPVFWRGADAVDRWTRNAGLSPATVAAIGDLSFRRGDRVFLADPAVLCARLRGQPLEEIARALRTLMRAAALVVSLHVEPDADVDALVAYWGRGGRTEEMRRIFTALTRVPGGGSVSLANLLPPTPRRLLYRFPKPSDPAWDCGWTALHFWDVELDETLPPNGALNETVAKHYEEVDPSAPMLGDVVVYQRADGTAIHTAVHLVDDLLFTKNGASFRRPWILSSRKEVEMIYFEAARVRAFRKRGT
jgi:hypothetical protein